MKQENHLPKYYTKEKEQLSNEEKKEYEKIKEEIIQSQINNTQINLENTEIRKLLQDNNLNKTKIINRLNNDLKGYGRIDPLLKDDELEEIMIIGNDKPIYTFHRKMGMMITDIILSENEIRQVISKIANFIQRKIDNQTPILDARLPDGSRVNATLPPITADGPTLTIRKFKKNPLTIFDLIKSNTINTKLAAFLWITVDGMNVRPSNLIIAGGTGSGKTTTLTTISSLIPNNERIITIEDTLELQIPQEHIIRTETRPPNIENKGEIDMDTLLKNTLRQRPDRIIVGEVRSKEAITLFTALNTGHSGMGTLHANSTQETINRLINPPMNVPQIMLNSLDFIIMQNRMYHPKYGPIRRVTEVAEVVGRENNTIQLNKIFEYDYNNDELNYVAISSNALSEIASMKGISYKEINEEIESREKYLLKNMDKKSCDMYEVKEIINNYYN